MAVACNLVTLNVTAPTNCQVRWGVLSLPPISNRLNQLPPQGLEHHQFREHAILFNSAVIRASLPPYLIIPDLSIYDLCLIFAIDYTSHVRFLRFYSSANIQRRHSFSLLASIAIWNKNKVIVGLSILVWGINGSFLVQGESLSSHSRTNCNSVKTWFVSRPRPGEEKHQSQSILDFLSLSTRRSALHGWRTEASAVYLTSGPIWQT